MTNKEKIINIISKNNCGISVKNILKNIGNIDKTTIYRNLEKLVASWEVLEDFLNNWEKIYSIKKTHHHHFICEKCGDKINIWCILEKQIKIFEKQFNFKIKNHSFLLSWLCEKCL